MEIVVLYLNWMQDHPLMFAILLALGLSMPRLRW